MVMLRALFTLASLCSISGIWGLPSDASSSPPSIRRLSKRFDEHTVHEERSHLPQHWEKRAGGLDKRKIIPVRFNVVQRNMDRAEEFLMEVSDPKSPKYGMHYKPEDVVDLFSPSQDSINVIVDWLADAGLNVSHNQHYDHWKGALVVNMTVLQAEELLKTTYSFYEHGPSLTPHIACTEYSVPKAVQPHIDFIVPTLHFDIPTKSNKRNEEGKLKTRKLTDEEVRSMKPGTRVKGDGSSPVEPVLGKALPAGHSPAANLGNCGNQIDINCLSAMYAISRTQTATAKNSLGIVEYTPNSYVPSDLDKFFSAYKPEMVGSRPILKAASGGVIDSIIQGENFNNNLESNLDLQYAMALTYPLRTTLYQVGDNYLGGSFNTFLDAIDGSYCSGDTPGTDPQYPDGHAGGYKGPKTCGAFTPTYVISTSYAYNEADLSVAYEQRQCNEYLKLGMMGVTMVFSSGDYGVAGNSGNCLDVGTTHDDKNGAKFNPSFPSTCPWVTSVGATWLQAGSSVYDPEVVANKVITSAGGFSNVFGRPSYQVNALNMFWSRWAPNYPSTIMNRGYVRGFPDLSANGVNYIVAIDGSFYYVYGTSASAPVVASMFALINDVRLSRGRVPIGFVNPTLYANPAAFHDVQRGTNPGCGTIGYEAVLGWDPATGLGTPKMQSLIDAFLPFYWWKLPPIHF